VGEAVDELLSKAGPRAHRIRAVILAGGEGELGPPPTG
jgi:hypothetical protein